MSEPNYLQHWRQQLKPAEMITTVVKLSKHAAVHLEAVHVLHTAYSGAYHRVVFTGLCLQGSLKI